MAARAEGSDVGITSQLSRTAVNCPANDDASINHFREGGYEAAPFYVVFYK